MHKTLWLASLLLASILGSMASAEYRTYGYVTLEGLARDNSWPYSSGWQNAMVCNVNGDGFLAIRTCASTACPIVRKLERLAILQVSLENRDRHWIYVGGAYRDHDVNGYPINPTKTWNISGWAHDGYMCDYNY